MNVKEMMTQRVCTCAPNDTLNYVAYLMWENDCGCVPVVDPDGVAVAMITDRDICMAAYTQGLPLTSIAVASAASRGIVTVLETATVERAESLMQEHQIRRLPVVDDAGRPVGIVSMNDLARNAQRGGSRHSGLNPESILRTLAAVCQPSVSGAAS